MNGAPHTTGHRIDRDDLLTRIDLTELLDALTPGQGAGHRRAWRCPEPDHPDEHPSVTVTTDRHGIQRWRCWSGGHGGTAIDAVIAGRHLTVGDAIAWLDDNYAHLKPLPRPPRPQPRPVGQPAPEVIEYITRCQKILWTGSGRHIRDWLHHRGLDDETLAANRVGADPGRRYLPRPKGLPAGWPAAVYPALDPNGQLTYFQARFLDPPEGRCKYDNPAKQWATNPRVAWTQPTPTRASTSDILVVTEGIPDALAAAQAGFRSVGVLGSTYPDVRMAEQISNIATNRAERVIVCFDADDAGRTGSKRLAGLLHAHGTDVVELSPPEGLDLSEWSMNGREMLEALRSMVPPDREAAIAASPTPSIEL